MDDDRVFADFGTVRGMSYYEDLTFEIYSPAIGSPLGGGGEYTFRNVGACGFAFHLEVLLDIFSGLEDRNRQIIEGDPGARIDRAKEKIRDGNPIEVKS